MVKLIAIKEVRYAGVSRVPGTRTAEFDASEKDAKVLRAVKKAIDAPAKAVTAAAVAQPEPVKTESLFMPKSETAEDVKTARRRYMRRDMTAADE